MQDLLATIATAIVDYPDQIRVNEIESEQTIVIELSVAKEDLGKLIGVKGRNINAIRAIMAAVSGKIKKRIIVEIVE